MRTNRSVIAVLALAALLAGTACNFGQKARDQTLVPSLRLAATGVRADAEAGVVALPPDQQADGAAQVTAFFEAFDQTPIRADARLLWPGVAVICEEGIVARLAAGSIGPHVAESLRERLRQFGSGLSVYFREES